jgi:uroporphyrin-III C-methyltransferase
MSRSRSPRRLRVVAGGRHAAPAPGSVSLVGAGPGDPELLTVAAVARLAAADVVYYDALVGPDVLAHARPGARLVPVGKRRGAAILGQEAIVAALVRDVRAGLVVVRLKGGDPFVFGRGGEEALALLRAGIRAEVVPGVSAGVAVPAAAGIPLTHRGVSSSAAFVTAHDLGDAPSGRALRRAIGRLARAAETLVVFMGGAHLDRLREVLIAAGVPPAMPAAVIESGTLPEERIRRGIVADLPGLGAEDAGPVLVVVGPTVALAEALAPAADARATAPVDDDAGLVLRSEESAGHPNRHL